MSDIKKSAEISPDGMYRYSLERGNRRFFLFVLTRLLRMP